MTKADFIQTTVITLLPWCQKERGQAAWALAKALDAASVLEVEGFPFEVPESELTSQDYDNYVALQEFVRVLAEDGSVRNGVSGVVLTINPELTAALFEAVGMPVPEVG